MHTYYIDTLAGNSLNEDEEQTISINKVQQNSTLPVTMAEL